MDTVAELRSFNRFYTRAVGLLDERLVGSAFTLPEARVLFELAGAEQTAAEVVRRIGIDKAHLSRIVARLRARGLLASRASPDHGRHVLLSLNAKGRAAFKRLDAGSQARVQGLLEPLDTASRTRLAAAMRDFRDALEPIESLERLERLEPHERRTAIALRPAQTGDIGWVTHRQALLYEREYGWDRTFEGLVARILGDFVAGFDPAREDAWIAEQDGAVLGSVFLMRSDDAAVARLRLLYVEPAARGHGVGRRLVDACIARARVLGYRTLTLWTNDVLVAARRIYQDTGFVLVHESAHRSFGHDLVGQTWNLDLAGPEPAAAPAPSAAPINRRKAARAPRR